MDFQKVSFKNKELDLNLAGILYTPDDLDVSKSYPAVEVPASGMTCISLSTPGTASNTSVDASRLHAFSPVMTR